MLANKTDINTYRRHWEHTDKNRTANCWLLDAVESLIVDHSSVTRNIHTILIAINQLGQLQPLVAIVVTVMLLILAAINWLGLELELIWFDYHLTDVASRQK